MLALFAFAAPLPAATRYVDSSHTAAEDSGEGGAARPYRSLAHAMNALQPGDTLNIAAGTYRESLVFPRHESWKGATVVQAATTGDVLIKGSDVVGDWEPLKEGLFVKRNWPVNSQQVFLDGKPLKQIGGTILGGYPERRGSAQPRGNIWPGRAPGGLQQMQEGSFYYDAHARSLYLRPGVNSLQGHIVEVSVRPRLAQGTRVGDVTLRNLRFQHANTTAESEAGALLLSGRRITLERVEVSHVDGTGVEISGEENLIKDSRALYCGLLGMRVRGANNRLIGNETSFNNTRGFDKSWEAGGIKLIGESQSEGGAPGASAGRAAAAVSGPAPTPGATVSTAQTGGSEVTGHRSYGNNGDGLRFFAMRTGDLIHDNTSAYNGGFGIRYEAGVKGYIYNNYVFANGQGGIYLPGSAESIVAHNLVAYNGDEGIAASPDAGSAAAPERQAKKVEPRENRVVGNIVAWNGKAGLALPDAAQESISDYNLYVSASEPPAFSSTTSGGQGPRWKGLDDWKEASGQDQHSWVASLDIPQPLQHALQSGQPSPQWDTVTAVASRLNVRAAGALRGEILPGLRDQAAPGPVPR
jgi:hypothetical protein